MFSDTAVAIGIDIGGTHTKLGIVGSDGSIREFQSFPTEASGQDPTPFLRQLKERIGELMRLSGGERVAGIGAATHGLLDEKHHGPSVCGNTPALRGLDIVGWMENEFGLPVILNIDTIAHALAEYYFGAGQGTRRFMVVAVGTGLGAGLIIDGRPLLLMGGTTGDAGRLIIRPDSDQQCVYGVRGSAEALCGVPAIERLAQRLYGEHRSAHDVISAARTGGDEIAIAIMQEIGANIGLTLANLSAIFFPDRIALTGGTTIAGPVLLQACRQKFDEVMGVYHHFMAETLGEAYHGVEIILGETGAQSGVLGAAVELFQMTEK